MPFHSEPSPGPRPASLAGLKSLRDAVAATGRHIGRNLQGTPLPPGSAVTRSLGKIVAAPDGKDEFTGCQYWVEVSRPKLSLTDEAALDIETDGSLTGETLVVPATNLAEWLDDTHDLAEGEPVELTALAYDGDAGGVVQWWFTKGGGGGMFPVTVTKDGGGAGSTTTTCSYTYTIKNLAGETLGTTLSPLRPRYANVEYTQPAANSYGLAFKSGGDWVLYEAVQEKPVGQFSCE